jgi:hypothetical protein
MQTATTAAQVPHRISRPEPPQTRQTGRQACFRGRKPALERRSSGRRGWCLFFLSSIFYYAVLSEVSPPTALSPFAAAAITGGSPYLTTLQSWKYTMPAFLVPFVFVLDPLGAGLLLSVPKNGDWIDIAWITFTTVIGIVGFAVAAQGWLFGRVPVWMRVAGVFVGVALLFPSIIDAASASLQPVHIVWVKAMGLGLAGAMLAIQRLSRA